jgi:hypothetical protein
VAPSPFSPPPDVVPQQFSRQNSSSKEDGDVTKKSITDLPSKLPSVKELAFKFLQKKSPEPMPRKSIKVC